MPVRATRWRWLPALTPRLPRAGHPSEQGIDAVKFPNVVLPECAVNPTTPPVDRLVAERLPMLGVSVNNLADGYSLADLVAAAREAEELGFDGVWVHDAWMGRRTLAAWDPITVLAAIASSTRRLRLCTGILQPHLRNPVHLATAWATLDALSEGRTLLGVGTGAGVWRLVERQYGALAALQGTDGPHAAMLYADRGALFDEALSLLRRLWTEDKVSHQGQHYHLENVTLGLARPHRPPPLLVAQGIYVPTAYGGPSHHEWEEQRAGRYVLGPPARVAALADGWHTCHATPAEYARAWARLQPARPPGAPPLLQGYNCFVNVSTDHEAGWQAIREHLIAFHGPPVPDDIVDRWAVTGSGAEIVARLLPFVAQGVSIFQFVIGARDQRGQMRVLARDVLPALRAAISDYARRTPPPAEAEGSGSPSPPTAVGRPHGPRAAEGE